MEPDCCGGGGGSKLLLLLPSQPKYVPPCTEVERKRFPPCVDTLGEAAMLGAADICLDCPQSNMELPQLEVESSRWKNVAPELLAPDSSSRPCCCC